MEVEDPEIAAPLMVMGHHSKWIEKKVTFWVSRPKQPEQPPLMLWCCSTQE